MNRYTLGLLVIMLILEPVGVWLGFSLALVAAQMYQLTRNQDKALFVYTFLAGWAIDLVTLQPWGLTSGLLLIWLCLYFLLQSRFSQVGFVLVALSASSLVGLRQVFVGQSINGWAIMASGFVAIVFHFLIKQVVRPRTIQLRQSMIG